MGPKMEISIDKKIGRIVVELIIIPLETYLLIWLVTLSFAAGSGGKGISNSEVDSSLTTFNANWSG